MQHSHIAASTIAMSLFAIAGVHAQVCQWLPHGSNNTCYGLWTNGNTGVGAIPVGFAALEVHSSKSVGIRADMGGNIPGMIGIEADLASSWVVYDDATGVRGAITALAGAGVYGRSTEDSPAIGVLGESDAIEAYSAGVKGVCSSMNGKGVYGLATAEAGQAYGVYGQSQAIDGVGVGGFATAATGPQTGVWGRADSPEGIGVYGYARSEEGANVGVRGHSLSDSGVGVYGSSLATGVYGEGTGGAQGIPAIGVHGKAEGRGAWAGFFEGDAHVTDRLAVGTQSTSFTLHVNGTAGKPGGGSWSVSSDARLKKDIRPLNGSLDQLLALQGVSFEYIDPESINEVDGRRIGMVAQQVEGIFPDWVDEGPDGYKRITYRGFEAMTVEALRELRAEKDAEIAALNDRVAQLEQVISRLLDDRGRSRAGEKGSGDLPFALGKSD